MDYINRLLQKWMPSQRRIAVDSAPKLHGIWDTINATLATPGPPARLPTEFYEPKARRIIDRIVVEEEYAGYKESAELLSVGIGALMREVVQRMVGVGISGCVGGKEHPGEREPLKMALFGSWRPLERWRGSIGHGLPIVPCWRWNSSSMSQATHRTSRARSTPQRA